MERSANKDQYYTADHEWVSFKGSVAYTGVCSFKLTGFRAIHAVTFYDAQGFKKQGEVIATIRYNDYEIKAHMPVDGKIVRVNQSLISGDKNILLQHPEQGGWIALINPSQPYERTGLLPAKNYQLKSKSHFVK
jgi:glycine cleavage system H protein